MSSPKKWPHNGEMITTKQVMELKRGEVSISWLRTRLNRGRTVQQVLDERVLTNSEVGAKGAKVSPWGASSFISANR